MAKWDSKWTDEMLGLYVLGGLTDAECLEIEALVMNDAAFAARVQALQALLGKAAQRGAIRPPQHKLGDIFAAVGRLEAEEPKTPPILHSRSTAADYAPWVDALLEKLKADAEGFVCEELAATDDTTTFLVKVSEGIPEEVHTNEIERILILEGTCEFQVGDQRTAYGPGDQFTIPMHRVHEGWVTSATPCYIVLQRTICAIP